jgi:hypothetical protein
MPFLQDVGASLVLLLAALPAPLFVLILERGPTWKQAEAILESGLRSGGEG